MTESQFLEAPLVRQADGELKNSKHKLINLERMFIFTQKSFMKLFLVNINVMDLGFYLIKLLKVT